MSLGHTEPITQKYIAQKLPREDTSGLDLKVFGLQEVLQTAQDFSENCLQAGDREDTRAVDLSLRWGKALQCGPNSRDFRPIWQTISVSHMGDTHLCLFLWYPQELPVVNPWSRTSLWPPELVLAVSRTCWKSKGVNASRTSA